MTLRILQFLSILSLRVCDPMAQPPQRPWQLGMILAEPERLAIVQPKAVDRAAIGSMLPIR